VPRITLEDVWYRFIIVSREWWSLPRVLATAFLLIGLLGEIINGPLPFIPGINRVYKDISPNLIAIGITVLILDTANEARARQQFRRDLIYRMKSRVNDVAVRAAEELERQGWLADGSLANGLFDFANLQGANLNMADFEASHFWYSNLAEANMNDAYLKGTDFWHANLENADFSNACLKAANLSETTLEGAKFIKADLEGADFGEAILKGARMEASNLRNAILVNADLQGANLVDADLHGALLIGANLRGADLTGSMIEGVNFYNLRLNKTTKLPDGTRWTTNTDIRQFGAVIMPVEVKRKIRFKLEKIRKKE